MAEVGFGLGSNIGAKAQNVRRAVRELASSGLVGGLTLSSLYRTAPWGNVDQDWFVNACAVGQTDASPHDLLALCLACEARMGRERLVRWGPRIIDIDLLYYGALTVDDPTLTLPHPEMLRRAFVLVPLRELRPQLTVSGKPIAEVLQSLDVNDIERLIE
jgi:2-amino-4-hydroxy-6-hydroxymethyldihydropteridine diphosphokinase